jgi:outer membrane protein
MRRFNFILILFFVFAGKISAQEKLTLEKAIEIALKNNHSILISQGENQITKNDATVGNAGMMPQITFNASGSEAINNTNQKFATGTEVNKKGATTTGISTGVALNWTLFDGMKMFATYDKLKTLNAMSEINLKIAIENTVAEVMNTYYLLAKQKQLLATIESSLQLYEERVKIAETKWKIGSGSKLDFLQAKVDMNAQKSNQLRQKNVFAEQKIALNKLLAQAIDTDFDVDQTIDITYQPAYSDLKTSVVNQNNSLRYLQKNIFGNELALREMRSQRYPKLLLNANYNFANTQSQAGIVLSNQTLGLTAGLNLSWNLYNGSNASRQIKNAQVAVNNSQLLFDELKFSVESSVLRAFNAFINAQQILKLEEENYTLAKENADVALESFRLGAVNTLQVKEAQNSLDAASVRLVNVRYEAKVAETELMRLNGALVK